MNTASLSDEWVNARQRYCNLQKLQLKRSKFSVITSENTKKGTYISKVKNVITAVCEHKKIRSDFKFLNYFLQSLNFARAVFWL